MFKTSLMILGILSGVLFAESKVDKLVLAGPFATVSHPLIHMVESGALKDVAKEVEFRLWKNPDELRALVLKGEVDFIAVPTNVGANLYNKGIDIKLLNVSVWGILGLLTRDKNLKTLKDFKGKEIAMPFRSDMPDIIFEEIVKRYGLDPKKDFKLRYVATPIDAMQLLIMRRVDHALLAEPAISIALRKTGSFPLKLVAPDLYRSNMLENEWGEVFKTEAKIPEAGMAYLGKSEGKEHIIRRFLEAYKSSLAWYKENPKEASKMVVKAIPMLEAEGLEDSISRVQLEAVLAQEAKTSLQFFFDVLQQNNPKVIGGKQPSDGFYYQ
ncbi:MAG: ABC transporter substrate-binding protein [Epsilonproteobacteria bacterium]|nr:ABC transporter substrate-binding protein [Campylobacterota bacterium]